MPNSPFISLEDGFHCPADVNAQSTGVYLAYPTTEVLKPAYRGHKTLVNMAHTKVGITVSSFRRRWLEYRRTFGGEVAFHPLFELPVPELSAYEARLLTEMLRRFPKSGSAREWFFTTERDSITELTRTLRVAGSVGI